MLKLVYNLTSKRGVRHEQLFLATEKRTAVEIARDLRDQPAKYSNVALFDFSLVKGEVVTIEPATIIKPAVEISRKPAKVPACSLVDLTKLPRKAAPKKAPARVRVLGVTVDAFDLPKKSRRVSKRERTYGKAEATVS